MPISWARSSDGSAFGTPAQDRPALAGVGLLLRLDLLPLLEHLARRVERPAGGIEDVRVAADQLGGDRRSESVTVKCPSSARDLREEHAFEDQVADLAAQRVGVAAVDRVEHLVRLLEHEAAQRLERLLAIPRAALRAAQPRHDVDEGLEGGAGVGGHEGDMLASPGGAISEELGVTFTAFVLSLATTAAVHFGDIADPSTGERTSRTSSAAGQMIEIIGMLQEKTKGNSHEPRGQAPRRPAVRAAHALRAGAAGRRSASSSPDT